MANRTTFGVILKASSHTIWSSGSPPAEVDLGVSRSCFGSVSRGFHVQDPDIQIFILCSYFIPFSLNLDDFFYYVSF